MKEYQNDHYRATVDHEGVMKVYQVARTLQKIESGLDGYRIRDITLKTAEPGSPEYDLLQASSGTPVFATCYGGGSRWHCDIDCGAQRFLGEKSRAELLGALKKCRFEEQEIKEMLAKCKSHVWDHCPRQVW